MNHDVLKELLDGLYSSYKHKFSSKDPVWNLHRFSDERDIELVALITSAYAYGSVDQINSFIEKLLTKIGNKPHEFTINFGKRKDKKHLRDMYYRFNSADDLVNLLTSLSAIIRDYGSLKNLFFSFLKSDSVTIIDALRGFSTVINSNASGLKGDYFQYLVSNPAGGSACKRMNLFLRWMVRKDEIDTGLWNEAGTHRLIMPVDTHIARISKKLKLVNRKTVDLKFAEELTAVLRKFDAVDPVKYDFALCHAGMEKRNIRDL
jgi:uncharacterized protein (TIGR02757 family)